MRIPIAFLLSIAAAAQTAPPPPLEIRGVVTEAGANSPIADAEVTVEATPANSAPGIKIVTGMQGDFRTAVDKPGSYLVRVTKPGYTDDGKDPAGANASNFRTLTVDTEHPSVEAHFRLARGGELRGLVIDDETGKPIPNFTVYPIGLLYYHGERRQIGGHHPSTDSEGRFVVTGLRPGNYLVEIGPRSLGKEQLLAQFTGKDLETVDHDYRRSYWPGSGGIDMALPVEMQSGGVADVGTIRARKVPYYRIHITLPAGSCPDGEKVTLDIETPDFIVPAGGGSAVCGKDYLLRNYESGAYEIHAMAGTSAENRMRVTVPVYVADKNIDVTVPLAGGVNVDGRVVAAEGSAKPPMDAIQVRMLSTGNLQFPDERAPVTPDSEGKFGFPNRPLARVRVFVSGLPTGFVVRELHYNGGHVVDNIFALNPNAPAHTLEIVIDDKPAAIAGAVTDSDNPVARPHVVLIRWPASSEDVFLSAKISDGDDNGKFQYAGLAPGEYRVLAVPEDAAGKLDEPHVLERLLSRADRVEVSPGQSQTLSLKLTDPSR